MPAGARFGDVCTGHDGFPPRTCDAGSPNVFINGQAANRVGDHWITHCNSNTCHDSTLATGSGTVFINGIAAGRVGDLIACGSAVAQGSSDTFFG